MPEDVLDILLTLSNLRGFVAGTRQAATSVRSIGTAAKQGSAESAAAGSRMSGAAGLARRAFLGTATAAAGFAYESTKMAINFDRQMEMVHTQAGATQAEVKALSNSVLAFASSGQAMQGPQQLAQALFHLESIGLRGANAMNALKTASQGAATGGANLEDTATALGAAWLVNIKGAGNLNNVMGLLNATVGAGNMRMDDLVQSLGTGVLAAGKLAGLGITDVFGALATLSDEGYKGSSAMAQLATSFHFLTDPTKKATTALARLGLTQFQLANVMRTQGLPQALTLLRNRLSHFSPAQSQAMLGDILPAGRGRVLEVLMNQVDRYGKKIHQIQGTSKNFAEDVAATHRTSAFKIHAAWSQIQADMIRVGHLLEPIAVVAAQSLSKFVTWALKVAPAIGHILPYLVPLVAGFVAYRAALLAAAAAEVIMSAGGFLAAIISLLPAVKSLKDAWILLDLAMDANPIFIVIAAIVAIGVAIFMAYKHFAWFRNAVRAVWNWLKGATHAVVGAMVAAFHWLSNASATVVGFIRKHWRIIIFLVLGPLGLAIDFVTKHWQWFSNAGKNAWHAISSAASWAWNSVIHPVFNWIAGAASWVVHAIGTVFNTLYKIISAPFSWAWNNVIKPVANWIVGAFRWVAQQIAKIFHAIMGPINAVTGTLKSVGGGIGHGIGKVANFLGIAEGGTVTSPGMAWVGEHGPELLRLPQGAQVRPLSSPGMPATGALGATFTFVVPVHINGREVARATGKYVDDRLARQ